MNTVPYIAVFPALRTRSTPPYQSQQGNGARNDCGPAAVLMLARWVGKGMTDTVAQWSKRIDPSQDGTTDRDLAGMIQALGLTPVLGATAYPRIDLVRYNKLPHQNPDYRNQTFLHWIVRLSDTTYHDPLWNGSAGANLGAPKSTLDAAIFASSMSVGIKERPQITPMTTQRTIKAISWNVRTAPTTKSATVGVLVRGDKVNTTGSTQGEGGTWLVIPAQAGGAAIKQAVDEKTPVLYYMRADGFEPLNAPAPTPQPQPQPTPLGTVTPANKILGVHELGGAGKAREALARGARAVMVFEDALGAAQMSLAYPDAIVMHRKYFTQPIAAMDLIAQHGINPHEVSSSRAWYRGINEQDVHGGFDGSPAGIRQRAAWDIECATILKRAAPHARWVAGGYAMGNPDFTNQAVCDAVRDGYAAAYNSGLILFDIHNYSKGADNAPKNFRHYGPIWFERRWQFLFEKCGFDPKVRGIVSTESGIEAGHGGFRWAGFTQDEFRAWCAFMLKVQQQPLIINGQSYPSPYIAGTLFQYGNNHNGPGGWWGYGLDEYMSVMEEAWRGQFAAEKSLEDIDLVAGEAPPAGFMPEPKVLFPDS